MQGCAHILYQQNSMQAAQGEQLGRLDEYVHTTLEGFYSSLLQACMYLPVFS